MNRDHDPDLDRLGNALRAATTVDLANEERAARTAKAAATPATSRRLRRPQILAGSSLGLAGIGAAVVVALSTSAPQPAFAVTPHKDGSVVVNLANRSGVSGANRKLASMGIHERLFSATTVTIRHARHGSVTTSEPARGGVETVANMPQSCLRDEQTGHEVVVLFPNVAAQKAATSTGTFIPPADAGNTGGPPNPDTFKVIPCTTSFNSGTFGSANSGDTGNS